MCSTYEPGDLLSIIFLIGVLENLESNRDIHAEGC